MKALQATSSGSDPAYGKNLFSFFSKVLRRVVKGEIFCLLSVERDSLPSVENDFGAGFSWGFIEARDLKCRLEPEHSTITESFVDKALEKGDRCFAVLHEGKLAHYSWYANSSTFVTEGVRIEFPEDWVYMYNAFTLFHYRGRSIYPKAVARALGSLPPYGFTTAGALVCLDNPRSMSPLLKIGFSEIGKMMVTDSWSNHTYTSKKCLLRGVKLVGAN